MKFKARIYHKSGPNKANLKEEKFFNTFKETKAFYESVFVYNDFSLNPTLWKYNRITKQWNRILGY